MYGVSKNVVVVGVYDDPETNQPKKPRLSQNRADKEEENKDGLPLDRDNPSRVSLDRDNPIPVSLDRDNPSPVSHYRDSFSSVSHDEFVTVLKVEDRLPPVPEGEEVEEHVPSSTTTNFITVLEVNNNHNVVKSSTEAEEVVIYRLPGERLGMALKFEGGVNVTDSVSRVFIQSINPDSPAARAKCFLKPLQEGDEILKIDSRSVREMTRLDCVTLLRDPSVCIRMVVKHQSSNTDVQNNEYLVNGHSQCLDKIVEVVGACDKPPLPRKKKGPPPPVPPRKNISSADNEICGQEELASSVIEKIASIERNRQPLERPLKRPSQPPPLPPRNSKPPQTSQATNSLPEKPTFKGGALSMKLPGWEELMQRRLARLGDPIVEEEGERPAEPSVYTDLFAGEDSQITESESDDTGSSVSTVIEKFSRNSTANSSFSEHSNNQEKLTKPFDLEQVLSPFEQLERELDDHEGDSSDGCPDTNISEDSKVIYTSETAGRGYFTIEPPESFQDSFLSDLPEDNNSFLTELSLEDQQNEDQGKVLESSRHASEKSSVLFSVDEPDEVQNEDKYGRNDNSYSYEDLDENATRMTAEQFRTSETNLTEQNDKPTIHQEKSVQAHDLESYFSAARGSSIETNEDDLEKLEDKTTPVLPSWKIKMPLNIESGSHQEHINFSGHRSFFEVARKAFPFAFQETSDVSQKVAEEFDRFVNKATTNLNEFPSRSVGPKPQLLSKIESLKSMETVETTTSVTRLAMDKNGSIKAVNFSYGEGECIGFQGVRSTGPDAETSEKSQTFEQAYRIAAVNELSTNYDLECIVNQQSKQAGNNVSRFESEDVRNMCQVTDEDCYQINHHSNEDFHQVNNQTTEDFHQVTHQSDEDCCQVNHQSDEDCCQVNHQTTEDCCQVNHQSDEDCCQVNHQTTEDFHQVTHHSNEDCFQVNNQTNEDFHQVNHQTDEDCHQLNHQTNEDCCQVNHQTDEDFHQVNHQTDEDFHQVNHQTDKDCCQVNHQTDEDYNQVNHQNDEDCCVSVRSLETKTWSQKEELVSTMNKEKQEICSNTMNSKNNEDGSPVVSGNQVILSTRHLEQFTSPPTAGVLVQVGMRDLVSQSTESSAEDQDTPNLTRSQNDLLTFTSFSKEPSDLCLKSCVFTEESYLELQDESGQEISSFNDEMCLSDSRLKDENLNVCQDAEPLDGFSMTQSPSNEAIDHTAKLETLSLSSRQQISSDTSASVLEKQVGVEVLETSPTEDIGSAKSDESFLKVETTNLSWSEDSSATDDSISDCVNMELISNSNPNVNEFFHKSSSFTLEVSRQPPDGHEFPPKYSEPSLLTTPSGGEDSGVFLDDQPGDPSQGSGPFHNKHSDKDHATELLTEEKTMKQATYCVLNGLSQTELPKDVIDYEKSIKKKRSPTPPPKPFVSPSFNPKNQPLQLSSSSLVEDNTFDRTIKKLTETTSDKQMKYISSGDIELVQNKPGVSCEKQNFIDQTSCSKRHIDMNQKNHENLKLSSNFYHNQFNHIPVSVKDRIAMFSRTASDTSVVPSDTTQKTGQSSEQPKETVTSKTRELSQSFEQPEGTVTSKARELYQSFEQPKETATSKTRELYHSFEQPEGTISSKTRELYQSFEQPNETATSKAGELSQSFEEPEGTISSKTRELYQSFEQPEGSISSKTPELYQSFEQPKETATSKTRELYQSFEQPKETVTFKTREVSQSFEQPKETATSKTRELSQSFEQPKETATSKTRELSQSFKQPEGTFPSKTRELYQSLKQPKETVTSKTRDQYLFDDSGKNIGVKNQHMGSNVGNEKQYIGMNEKAVDVSGAPLGKDENLVKKNWNFVNETCPQSTEDPGLEQSTKKEGFLSEKYKLNTSNRSKPSSSLDKDHQSSIHLGNFGVSCSEINMTSSRSQEDLLNRPSNWNFLSLLQKASKSNGPKFKGLVIPERPISTNSAIKSLPTIASKTARNSKPEPVKAFANQMWKNETTHTPEKTKSLPRDLNIISRSLVITKDVVDRTSNQTLLSEPPWKSYNPSLPKYSPAFKRRSLQLPRSNVTSSVSPTPPSSLTSPASPSSISSSNNSSLGITCPSTVTKQSVFQFSLSHSKPVTPVLPEKPTMPPAPGSSDSEGKDYEQSTRPIISLDDELEKPNKFSKQTKSSSVLTASSSEQNVNFTNSKHRNSNNPCPNKHQKQSPQFSNSKNSYNSSKLKYNLPPLDQTDASSSASNPVSRTNSNGSRDSIKEVKDTSSLINLEVQGRFLAKPVCIDIGDSEAMVLGSISEGENNSENFPSFPPTVLNRQSLVGDKDKNYTVEHDSNQKCPQNGSLSRFTFKDRPYSYKVESDDDSLSTISQITEDSRQTVDGSVSDTASDSLDHPVDAEFKPRLLSQQKTVLRRRQEGPSDESKNFRALAERWEQKSFDDISSPPNHPIVSKRDSQTLNTKFPPSLMPKGNEIQQYSRRNSVFNQFTNSTTASDVKMRESRSCGPRPTSLIEERDKKKVDSFWSKRSLSNTLFTLKGESTDGKSVGSKNTFNGSRESLDELGRRNRYMSTSTRSMSVSDILKNFENKNTSQETSLLPKSKPIGHKSFESCSNLYNRYEGRKISDECSSSVVQSGSRNGPKGSTPTFKCNSFGLADVNSSPNFNSDIHLSSGDCTNTTTFPDNRQTSEFTNTSVQCVNGRARGKPSDNLQATSLSKDQSTSKSSYPVLESGNLEVTETQNTLFLRQPKRYLKPHCDKPITADKPTYPRTYDNENCMPTKTGSVQIVNKRNSDILDFTSTSSRDKMHSSQYKRFSSVDSSASDTGKNSSLEYQSGTSPASDHSESRITLSSTISLEDRQQMLEEANRFLLEEPMSDGQEVSVVVIQRKSQVGSVGITLAGGADYEVKEVTIHKVIAGSLAERNGQIKKGDRVLSINGCNLKGLTHQEALDILKAPRNEIVLVLARKRSTNSRFPEPCISSSLTNGYHSLPNKLEQIREPSASTSTYTKEKIITVELQKDKTGIGFSLDGGKNSPVGDRPLTIKKVFKGGDTDRLGLLKAGDEILSLNNQTLTGMTRTEAWNFMKKLPEGQVSVTVKQR